jgi:hypothetical protein
MEKAGLIAEIIKAVARIDFGRKAFMIDGQEHEGHLSWVAGMSEAGSAYNGAIESTDSETTVLVEEAYLQQEYHFCHRSKINRSLPTPGINMIEKELMKLRLTMLDALLVSYMKKQKEALDMEI